MATARDVDLNDYDDELDDDLQEEQSESTTRERDEQQPKSKKQAKPNWNDDPEFVRQRAEMQRRAAQAENYAREAADRARHFEQQLRQIQLSGMDDSQRALAERDMMAQQLQEIQRQRDLEAFAMERDRDLREMSEETGMPYEELAEQAYDKSNHQMWKIARKWERDNREESVGKNTRQPDDRVDMGSGGKPKTSQQRFQAKYDDAKKLYNYKDMVRLEEEAHKAGVTINL